MLIQESICYRNVTINLRIILMFADCVRPPSNLDLLMYLQNSETQILTFNFVYNIFIQIWI